MWIISQLRSRIRYKIIGPFLILAVCTAIFGSAVAFWLVADSWQERFVNQLAAMTRIANDTVIEQEMTNLLFLRQVAFASANPAVQAPAVSDAVVNSDVDGLRRALEPFFQIGISEPKVQLDRLIVFDPTMQSLVDMERTSPITAPDVDYVANTSMDLSGIPFVRQVLQQTPEGEEDKFAGLLQLPDHSGTMVTYLCTLVPVRHGDNSAVVGGVMMAIRLDNLLEIIRRRSQAVVVSVHDVRGNPLASTAFREQEPDPLNEEQNDQVPPTDIEIEDDAPVAESLDNLQMNDTDLERLEEQGRADQPEDFPVVTTRSIGGRDYEIFYTYLIIHNSRVGILAVGMSSDYVVSGVGDTRVPLIIITIGVLVAILVIGFKITQQITAPLEKLVATASTFVAGGSKQAHSALPRPPSGAPGNLQDEIGILAGSFQQMTMYQQRLIRRVLNESSQRAAILESIPDGIVVCDGTGTIYNVNPSMRRLLGLSEQDSLPAHFDDLPLRPVEEHVFGVKNDDLYTLNETIVRVSKSPIFLTHDTYIGDVYLLQDMTAEVNMDHARTNFTATISHEMRTPLTVVHGNIELLKRGLLGSLDEAQQQIVDTAHQHTSAMSRSLANTILISEIDSGSLKLEPEAFDLTEALDDAMRSLQRLVSSKAALTLDVDMPEDLPLVFADEYMFAPILEQLVRNAVTYTDTGTITIRVVPEERFVRIAVSDTGCGMSDGLLERVFERFVRGEGTESNDRPDRGIGLGLTIAKELVERQGGQIAIDSQLDEGTTVSFTLPLHLVDGLRPAAPTAMHDAPTTLLVPDGAAPLAQPMTLTTVNGNGKAPEWLIADGTSVSPHLLTLPAMMTLIVDLLWRKTRSIHDIRQALHSEGLLPGSDGPPPAREAAQHMDRLSAHMFQRLLLDILPQAHQRWQQRQRPLSPVLSSVQQHFSAILSVDGTTMESMQRRIGLYGNGSQQASGHIAGLMDIGSRLPRALWYEEDLQQFSGERFWERIMGLLRRDMLLICNLDLRSYTLLQRLTDMGVGVITSVQQDLDYQRVRVLQKTDQVRDQMIQLNRARGAGQDAMRLVEVWHRDRWQRYLTNIVQPERLPAEYVRVLHAQHRRVDASFDLINQLLLHEHGEHTLFSWSGSPNAIQVQVWASWVLYVVLLDLTDAVAEALHRPFGTLSPRTVYHALYDFQQAQQRGEANDPVMYMAARARDLGLLKNQSERQAVHRSHSVTNT